MDMTLQMIVTIMCSVIASSGFWAFIQRRSEKKDAQIHMLVSIGHTFITTIGMGYIERGWVTQDEYEDLNDYIYKAYKELGGNGSAERIMEEVKKLPIKNKA